MLISEKNKYIFISIPKTGITAIQSFLIENANSCVKNVIRVGSDRIKVAEHVKTKKLKELMGKAFDEYTIFTFIRDPKSRGVSTYFFYKNGNTLKSHDFIRNLMARLNVFLTQILPFSLW